MSYDLITEDVPEFINRIGDWYAQGSNNSLIVLGTDRAKAGAASIDDGLGTIKSAEGGKNSGCALIVVGRKDKKGNPDLINDSAYLYLSMKTDGDKNIQLDGTSGDSGKGPYAILKSDSVRVIGRKDIKISHDSGKSHLFLNKEKILLKIGSTSITISDGLVSIDTAKIELGKGANLGAVLVDKLTQTLNDLNSRLESHVHPTAAAGPPSPPTPASPVIVPNLASKRTFVDAG